MSLENFVLVVGGGCTILSLLAAFWPQRTERFDLNKKFSLVVSDLNEETINALRDRAELNGVSIEEEHRSILEKALLATY